MGNVCTVIDSMNSGMKVGTSYPSRRDLHRNLPPGIGMKVGYESNGKKNQLRRAGKTTFIEPYGKSTAAAPAPGRHRPTGHKMYTIVDAQSSGLAVATVYGAERTMVREMRPNSTLLAVDPRTGAKYSVSRAGTTYRVRAA